GVLRKEPALVLRRFGAVVTAQDRHTVLGGVGGGIPQHLEDVPVPGGVVARCAALGVHTERGVLLQIADGLPEVLVELLRPEVDRAQTLLLGAVDGHQISLTWIANSGQVAAIARARSRSIGSSLLRTAMPSSSASSTSGATS